MGSNVAQSVAGLSQAERIEARAKRPAATAAERRKDDPDHVVVKTETAEAVRALKSSDQEEAREDRQEHPPYTPQGGLAAGAPAKQIDVSG